jgi:hypothetical protein
MRSLAETAGQYKMQEIKKAAVYCAEKINCGKINEWF